MSVTIRLAKFGKRNAPSYRVVAAETRSKRNGRFLDVLGYFNPSKSTREFELDEKKYKVWKEKGALTTDAVEKLIEGTYNFVKYEPNQNQDGEKNTEPHIEEN